MPHILVNLTGLAALSLNIAGLVRTSDRSLRHSTGWASALWAANNLLIGAQSAAALSFLSVGRQVSASAVQGGSQPTKLFSCLAFLAVTLAIGVFTWNGMTTLFSVAGSMLATYAMFYMRGAGLRLAMIGVASLWMYNAWAYDSWWQMFANTLNGAAAAYGAAGAPASSKQQAQRTRFILRGCPRQRCHLLVVRPPKLMVWNPTPSCVRYCVSCPQPKAQKRLRRCLEICVWQILWTKRLRDLLGFQERLRKYRSRAWA